MSKKRVHELAKELGLDNKEVVDRLRAAGMDIKTHSSTVYEEEAKAILLKNTPVVEVKAPVKVARPGMMIVKKAQPKAETAGAPSTSDAESTPVQEAVEPSNQEFVAPREAPVEVVAENVPVQTAPTKTEPARQEATPPKPQEKRDGLGAQVVRMIDREKLAERVPSRRFGGAAQPQASGDDLASQKFGRVTELRVVQDPFGRGREMIDVGREKKAKVAGKVPKKQRAPSKREMMEMRGRAMHPARLKKKKVAKRPDEQSVESTLPRTERPKIKIREATTVADLSRELGVKAADIIAKLMEAEIMVTQNQSIDLATVQLLSEEFDFEVESVAFTEKEHIEAQETEGAENLKPRPPVVTVMGHVDHGKTSLLDAIRQARVAAGEAGGITQHIGAYSVPVPGKGTITFLDTPGHAAFTSMRARGASVTDIVVLVVAADDGVMPQTEEAIKHAQAAEVPIIVAVNKIDRPDAQPERVMQQLANFGLQSEQWGGETLFVNTSATKGTGIKELLENILLQAEVLELKANPDRSAVAVVVEASLDKGRGAVATVLVQSGTLKRGDSIVAGEFAGKIRSMTDDRGRELKEVGPSGAAEITGLEGVPQAGDTLNVVEDAEAAREVAEHRQAQKRAQELNAGGKMSLEDLMAKMKDGETQDLRVVIKADVQGSVEAVRDTLLKMSTSEIRVNVLYAGVGGIKETDINLAAASKGMVLGFGVRPDANARAIAERQGVEIRTYNIIYEMVDDVKKAMEGLLSPESREKLIGRAEVLDIFKIAKVGVIAGCRVTEGKALRSARVRVLRDSAQVYEGKIGSLKHFKNDAREVEVGQECGVGVENFNDVKQGDVLEFFQVEEIARKLDTPVPSKRRDGQGGVQAQP